MVRQCITLGEIRESDLVTYIRDIASPRVCQHIERCSACQSKIDQLFNSVLDAAFYRVRCPDSDELIDYQEGLLSHSKQQKIEYHVKICSYCQDELALLDELDREPFG